MIVIGLTGGIGMGKSTVASQLKHMGAQICSADAIVHDLLAYNKEVIAAIDKAFPGAVENKKVNRKKLGEIIFPDPEKRHALEEILHPLVVDEENKFIERQHLRGTKLVVLEIPLLFETGAQSRCDLTLLACAPPFIQKQRVMRRANMTEEKFAAIVAAQMPDEEKRALADGIIPTGLGKAYSYRAITEWVRLFDAA